MVSVTPADPDSQLLIDAYGDGGFRFAGVKVDGPTLVLPGRFTPWEVSSIADLSIDSLAPVFEVAEQLDILLIGCGPAMTLIPKALKEEIKARGLSVDAMDTGAACRTYNVLAAEERRVAAALIAV